MSGWIKTEERRPKNEERVLVTVREGTELDSGELLCPAVLVGYFYEEGEVRWYSCFHVDHGHDEFLTEEVIAWMPMPEPYREQDGEV